MNLLSILWAAVIPSVTLALQVNPNFGDGGALELAKTPLVTKLFPGSLYRFVGEPYGDGNNGTYVQVSGQDENQVFFEALLHLRSDGSIDPRFGDRGIIRFDNGIKDLVVDSGGLTVLRNRVDLKSPELKNFGFAIERYTADGKIDLSFGDKGRLTVERTSHMLPRRLVVNNRQFIVISYGLITSGILAGSKGLLISRVDEAGSRTTEIPLTYEIVPAPGYYRNDDFVASVDPATRELRIGFSIGGIEGLSIYTSYALLVTNQDDQVVASSVTYLHQASYVMEQVPAVIRDRDIYIVRKPVGGESNSVLKLTFPTMIGEKSPEAVEFSLETPRFSSMGASINRIEFRDSNELFLYGSAFSRLERNSFEPAIFRLRIGAKGFERVPVGGLDRFRQCQFDDSTWQNTLPKNFVKEMLCFGGPNDPIRHLYLDVE